MIKIACLTNDKAVWATRPFAHQFNKYWSEDQPVTIVGFNKPDFELPANFDFHSVSKRNWPASKWSNQLISYLNSIDDDLIIIMLEDYWLNAPVDKVCVLSMWEYAQTEPNLLRIDLTADRRQHNSAFKYHEYNGYDIIRTKQPTEYQMSLQAAIWHRKNLLKLLLPEQTAWEIETDGSKNVPDDMRVLGTKVHPVPYIPTLRRNKTGLQKFNLFSMKDQKEILELIPKGKR